MHADAIIIGAGHNGLVAANLLADAGWEVVVLEATGQPGGAVRSGELAAPGYLSDLCSAFYPLAVCSPALRRLRLDEHGLRWRHAPDVLAHLLPDDRAVVLNRDPTQTAVSIDAFAPGDGERWLATHREWRSVSNALVKTLLTPFPPVRHGFSLLRTLRAAGAIRMARRLILSAEELSGELFAGEGAKLLLTGCALHTDLSPHDAGGGVYGWLLAMLGQQYGFPVPDGGAQRLTDALVARLAAKGGTLICDARAVHVAVSGGRAAGVRCAGGQAFWARRAVLADVPAPALYLDLLDRRLLPARLIDDMAHFRWDGATVKVDWALSSPVPWANPAVGGAGTVHLGVDMRGLARYAADLAAGDVPSRPFVLVGQMTTADPARSPAGTESLWAYTHLPHAEHWPADVIAEHAQRIQETIEKHAPGFAETIVGKHVSGPSDLEDENPSLVGGALGGGTAAAYQQLFLRPIPGLGRADTPIDGLFLASASAHPGGGVHGAPGANAARAALARHRAGFVYRAVMGAAHRALYRPSIVRP
ncbi:phytoene desaturase family protein [Allorhizocola rhizosphaerae]|uniref:phytoene desaturase family protein n=1 Tax=Allorhizocola rhizosphaerae TaxID=1872709 RepID=UPI000E3E2581|nr:NAD(P)/FAD-dependent oxidoreductase [Allorhizocola rhizosphaerae]